MEQGEDNGGRGTDSPGGRHHNRTNGASTRPPQGFLQAGCPSCRPTNSVKELKALRVSNDSDKYADDDNKKSHFTEKK